jgi:hypothetical protein
MRVIAEEDYLSSRSIQHQWTGKHIQSDISKYMLVSLTISDLHKAHALHVLFDFFVFWLTLILFIDSNTCNGREQVVFFCLGFQKETTDHIRTIEQIREMGPLRQSC